MKTSVSIIDALGLVRTLVSFGYPTNKAVLVVANSFGLTKKQVTKLGELL